MMLEIGWKSFRNCWPCFKVVKNLSTPSVFFRSCCKIFGNLWKSSEIFGSCRKSSEIFRNLWKPSVNRRKFRFCGDEKYRAFYYKKVGRYIRVLQRLVIHFKGHAITSSQSLYGYQKIKIYFTICNIIIHSTADLALSPWYVIFYYIHRRNILDILDSMRKEMKCSSLNSLG